MSAQTIQITDDTALPLIFYKGQPVLTFALIDKAHGRPEGTAKDRFNSNRKRFIEGEDWYRIDFTQKYEFHTFGISIPPRGLILLTETGYLMLVKSFTDDLAWRVQRQLVKVYFRAKQEAQAATQKPTDIPLDGIAHWIVAEYIQSLGTYLNRSGQQIGSRIHAHLRARFGVANVRDITADRLDELLTLLEGFHGRAYRLWWVCRGLELALLQTLHVAAHETPRELPPWLAQAMADVAMPGLGGTVGESIRSKALERLAGQIQRRTSLSLH